MKPRELAKLLHESYLVGYGPPVPKGWDGAKAWADLTPVSRRQYIATARVLLRRLTITPKPAPEAK